MAVGARQPAAKLFLCDVDTVALVAARENVPGAQLLLGDGWGAVELGARFDLVLSNPPLHRGHAEDRGVLDALVQQAPLRLVAGGRLVLVTWKVAGIAATLGERFARVDLLADACGYQVWQATAR
jgi:16S rRNA G1207 methylase RsmC